MPTLSFEVGAIFSIEAGPAISALGEVARAFTMLDDALTTSVEQTTSAVDRMIAQIARVGEAWRVAAAEAGGAMGGGRGGGGGGGRGGRLINPPGAGRPEEEGYVGYDEAGRMNDRYDQGQRMNAEAENRNRDQISREEAAADAAEARAATRRSRDRWKLGNNIFSGMGPFVAPFLGYEAEKGAMTEDRALAQSLIEMGFSPNDPGFPAMVEEMRGKVYGATTGTIYSESHAAGALPGTAGQFGAVFKTPEERRQAYMNILPGAVKFGEVAEQFHRGGLQESVAAAIAYSNMTHTTQDPKAFGTSLDTLLAIALTTGNTVAGEQNIMKYSVPIGEAAGVDANKTAAITGFFEMMGMRGTTAGTGVGQLFMGLTNTGGPLAAQQQSQKTLERGFEFALHMDPKALHEVAKSRGSEHVKAMEALHLYDATGHVAKDVAPGGKLDADVFFEKIDTYLKSGVNRIDAMGVLAKAFTVRGSREADLFTDPQMFDRLVTYLETVLHPKSVEELQKELATRPLQQFEQMLANIANIGNTLATSTLSPLNDMFKEINIGLINFNDWLKANPLAQEVGGWGLLIAGVVTGLGLFGAGIKIVTTGLSVFAGAATEAGAAATAVGIGLRGLLGILTPLLALKGDTGPDAPPTKDYQSYLNKEHAKFLAQHPMTWGADPEHHAGVAPGDPRRQLRSMTDSEHHSGLSPASPLTVNITNTFSGITDVPTMLARMRDSLADGIKSALSHMSSDPHGTGASVYTSPGYLP